MTGKKPPTPVVLVVDDEPLIRWSLTEGLTEGGYVVRQAATGAEARTVLGATLGEPMVVLLDLRLPDVTDLSLLREIRERLPQIPVIVITAHGTPEDTREARKLGVFRVVDKPFDVTEVVQLVAEASLGGPNGSTGVSGLR
jgi:two-component system nitrogen regulation response regulator GlnG